MKSIDQRGKFLILVDVQSAFLYRVNGILPASAAIEYAAQAMAVHAALTRGGPPQRGFLVVASGVTWTKDRLDGAGAPLIDSRLSKNRLNCDFFLYARTPATAAACKLQLFELASAAVA